MKRIYPNKEFFRLINEALMTKTEIAEKIGISTRQLHRIINKEQGTSIKTALNFCKLFKKPFNKCFKMKVTN